MRLGYIREELVRSRANWKMMFGYTINVGLDPFSWYPGRVPWAVVWPDHARSAAAERV